MPRSLSHIRKEATAVLADRRRILGDDHPDVLRLVTTLRGYSLVVSQRMGFFLARPNKDDLAILGELPEAGKLAPLIDWFYPWSEVA